MHFFAVVEFVPADPRQNDDAKAFCSLIDSFIVKYCNQEITGMLHSNYHMPARNYLYNSNVAVQDSAFYADCIDQELVVSKGLDEKYILAANIEESITYDPNNVPPPINRIQTEKYYKDFEHSWSGQVYEPLPIHINCFWPIQIGSNKNSNCHAIPGSCKQIH